MDLTIFSFVKHKTEKVVRIRYVLEMQKKKKKKGS